MTIGLGTCIYDHDYDYDGNGGYISHPITIGENAVIAAGTIVIRDVPSENNCFSKKETQYIDN